MVLTSEINIIATSSAGLFSAVLYRALANLVSPNATNGSVEPDICR
jgi:hypothetical protein